MADTTNTAAASWTARGRPVVRTIGLHDIVDSLRAGWDDFRANPTHLIFLGLIYPIAGLVLGRMASGDGALPLVYPLVAGFALLGPFAAVGLYDFSHQREQGRTVSWRDAFDVFRSPRIGGILILGIILTVLFVAWLRIAEALFNATMLPEDASTITGFIGAVLTTAAGWKLIVFGTAAGFVFAVVSLTLGVVSFPMLVDRDLGGSIDAQVVTAVQTSVRAVLANPIMMAVWGLIVAASMVLGAVTLLVGFALTMPVLGHATWHLYRRLVVV